MKPSKILSLQYNVNTFLKQVFHDFVQETIMANIMEIGLSEKMKFKCKKKKGKNENLITLEKLHLSKGSM